MRKLALLGLSGLLSVAAIGTACSASDDGGGFEPDGSGASGSGEGGNAALGSNTGGFNPSGNGGSGAGTPSCDHQDAAVDFDMDGFFPPEDCNDCDPNSNPGAVEVIVTEPDDNGNIPPTADEDCDGTGDNPVVDCDTGIDLANVDPNNGARAIDLCKEQVGSSWGVISAAYVRANGTPTSGSAAVGILDNFGPNVAVQKGQRMLAISSGHSRIPGQPDVGTSNSTPTNGPGVAPAGFPQNVPNCEVDSGINDDIGLELRLRAPTNATGYKFRFKFYSFEYAEYVCTPYNDQFIAVVDPPPMGANNGNISFDSANNPVSVNIAFFDVCDPAATDFALYCTSGNCPAQPNPYCPAGTGELQGNGFLDAYGSFEDGGATLWLETQAPIGPAEEFSIRFAIFDTSDPAYDSTTLIDSFEWIANGGTVSVGTDEVPDPK
jgi:hypothetical protein